MPNQESPFEDELETQLRLAIDRVEPPARFADGVLRRLQNQPAAAAIQCIRPTTASSPTLRLAAVLLLMLLLPLGNALYQRHRQAQAEKAAQQFALAMRLTHAALVDAGRQVFDRPHSLNTD